MQLPDKQNWTLFAASPLQNSRSYVERADEINAMVRTDSSTEEVRRAVNIVNRESIIGLDERDAEFFTLMLTGLKDVKRFLGNKHIGENQGSNTAAHCLSVCAMVDDVFKGAFEGSEPSRVITELRHRVLYATLMHDFGEMVTEFTSLARATRLGSGEQAQAERDIAEFFTKLALTAVETKDSSVFFETIDDLRHHVQHTTRKQEEKDVDTSATAAQIISQYIQDFDKWPKLDSDQTEHEHKQRKLKAEAAEKMDYYDTAEKKYALSGPVVKSAQREEGELFFQRRQGKNGGIPWDQATSGLILAAVGRIEGAISQLYQRTDITEQKELAAAVHAHIYETALAHLDTMPDVISREILIKDAEAKEAGKPLTPADRQTIDPEPGTKERAAHHKKLLAAYKDARKEHGSAELGERLFSGDTITRYEATLVYKAALMAVKDGKFKPAPNEMPLLAMRSIPDALKPYIEKLHEEERTTNNKQPKLAQRPFEYVDQRRTENAGLINR